MEHKSMHKKPENGEASHKKAGYVIYSYFLPLKILPWYEGILPPLYLCIGNFLLLRQTFFLCYPQDKKFVYLSEDYIMVSFLSKLLFNITHNCNIFCVKQAICRAYYLWSDENLWDMYFINHLLINLISCFTKNVMFHGTKYQSTNTQQ